MDDREATPRVVELDMREVPLLKRLDVILKAWSEIRPGEAIRLRNDREPLPLRLLFGRREKGRHDWSYETQGPDEWVALIRRKG